MNGAAAAASASEGASRASALTRSSSAPTSPCCRYSWTAAASAAATSVGEEEIMSEKYTGPAVEGAELTYSARTVSALLERLLPRANGALVLGGLLAERAVGSSDLLVDLDAEASPAARELARVRRLY